MPYLVQLHIFSGRPDPVWTLSDRQAAELFEQQRIRPRELFEQRSQVDIVQAQAELGLGYRGFSILELPHDHPHGMILDRPPAEGLRAAFFRDDADAERHLLATGAELLDPAVAEAASAAIARPRPAPAGTGRPCPKCQALFAPAYNPGYWNNTPSRRTNNNCYNYAANKATNSFAQPGRATGHMYTALTCPSVRPAAIGDGLRVRPGFSSPLPVGWYVALVIWPGFDFHWYRQDKRGCWSHKPGSTAARNTDNGGNTIGDPKTCDRGPYTVFCCYMTTHKGVRIS